MNRIFVAWLLLVCAHSVGAQDGSDQRGSDQGGRDQGKQHEVVLRIPFAEGERHSVWRGPGEKSHSDVFNRYAVDFSPLDEGHVIVSACAGKVVFVKEDTGGPTGDWRDNNEVAVLMPNGKDVVVYLHLVEGGVEVVVGDQVLPGDVIGRAGNTGNSEATHLHMDVRKAHRLGPSIPWRFAMLPAATLVRAGLSLRSQNICIRDRLAPLRGLRRAMKLAAALGEPALVTRRFRELRSQQTRAWPAIVVLERDSLLTARAQEASGYVTRLRLARPCDRAALAWKIREAFTDAKAVEMAAVILGRASAGELRDIKEAARQRAGVMSALKKALDLEHKLSGGKKSKRSKRRRQARKAFARAVKGWPVDHADLVRKYAAGL